MVPAVYLFYATWAKYGLGQIWPIAYFCKLNFIGIQACSFIFLLSVVAFTLSWQNVLFATQTIWPTKLKLFNIWNLEVKLCWPLYYTNRCGILLYFCFLYPDLPARPKTINNSLGLPYPKMTTHHGLPSGRGQLEHLCWSLFKTVIQRKEASWLLQRIFCKLLSSSYFHFSVNF